MGDAVMFGFTPTLESGCGVRIFSSSTLTISRPGPVVDRDDTLHQDFQFHLHKAESVHFDVAMSQWYLLSDVLRAICKHVHVVYV
jgi:hypothetical protein